MRLVFVALASAMIGCAAGGNGDASSNAQKDSGAPIDSTIEGDSSARDVFGGVDGPIFDAFDETPCASGATHACKTTCGTLGEAACAAGVWSACKPTAAGDPCKGLDCTGKGDGLEHTYHRDADGDGYGDPKTTMQSCEPPPSGWVTSSDDCDDTNPAVHPGAKEICNKIDDDCDGKADEGLHVAKYEVTYTDAAPCVLTDHASCKTGAYDWCRAHDPACYDGGFGPVELGPSSGSFVCISGGKYTGTWAEVNAAQPACSDNSKAGLRVCESAVHRAGVKSGFGSAMLQNHVPGDWKYLGIDPARTKVESDTWSALTGFHPGCTLARVDEWDCNAAVERDCIARGHVAGFGPVEYDAANVAIVCLDP